MHTSHRPARRAMSFAARRLRSGDNLDLSAGETAALLRGIQAVGDGYSHAYAPALPPATGTTVYPAGEETLILCGDRGRLQYWPTDVRDSEDDPWIDRGGQIVVCRALRSASGAREPDGSSCIWDRAECFVVGAVQPGGDPQAALARILVRAQALAGRGGRA